MVVLISSKIIITWFIIPMPLLIIQELAPAMEMHSNFCPYPTGHWRKNADEEGAQCSI
jgi:hypothetical protein